MALANDDVTLRSYTPIERFGVSHTALRSLRSTRLSCRTRSHHERATRWGATVARLG